MAATRWLDEEEQLAWRAIVDGFHHLMQSIDGPVRDATELTAPDYAMLVRLSEAPERSARMSELAECSGLPSGQVTYRVDRLVKLGYLERRPSETDRRGSVAILTEQGLATFDEAAAIHVEAVRSSFLDNLTRAELVQLGALMKKATGSDCSD